MGCIECIPNGNVRAKHVFVQVQLLPFPFPRLCHSVMWALRQMFLLSLWPLKHDMRAYTYTRVHVCICFTYVTPCVISLLINVEVLKALSAELITHKPFSNLPARLGSVVLRSIVKLTQRNYTLGPAPNGQIEKEEEGESCWKPRSILLDGFRASHAAGQCLALGLSTYTSGNQLKDSHMSSCRKKKI